MRPLAGSLVRVTALRLPMLLSAVVASTLLSAALPVMAQQAESVVAPGPVLTGRGTTTQPRFYTNSYALLIGVSRYKNAQTNLVYPSADVTALRDLLVKWYDFPSENITVLLDEQATKANIEKALAGYSNERKVKPTDRLLIYFSGHGQTVKLASGGDMGFLIPHDANVDLEHPDDRSGYLSTCLRMDTVWGFLEACSARHCLLIADACYGGLLAQSRSLKEPPNERMIKNLLSRPGRQAITAGGAGETVFENPSWGHGALTYKLIEELNAQATTPGTVFLASQLATTLKTSVGNLTEGKQTPQYGSYKGAEGDFIFYSTDQVYSGVGIHPPSTAQVSLRQRRLADIETALSKKQTEKAIAIYTELLATTPNDYDLYLGRGKAFGWINQGAKAISDFTKCIQIRPTAIEAYTERIYAYERQKQYADAIKDLDQIEALDATEMDYEHRGQLHLILKEYDAAIEDLKKFTAHEYKDGAYGFFYLGDAYSGKREYDLARKAYTSGIKTDPSITYGYRQRAWLSIAEQNPNLAIHDFDSALDVDSKDAPSYFGRGYAYLLKKTPAGYRSAEADFTKCLSLVTNKNVRLSATTFLGEAQSGKGNYPAALASLNRVLTATPGNTQALCTRGWVFIHLRQYPSALRDLHESVKNHPEGIYASRSYLGLASIYMDSPTSNLPQAERMAVAALDALPTSTDAMEVITTINLRQKRYLSVILNTDRMLELLPRGSSRFISTLGIQGIAYALLAKSKGEDKTLTLKAVTTLRQYLAFSHGDTTFAKLGVYDLSERTYAQKLMRRYSNSPKSVVDSSPKSKALPEAMATASAQLLSHSTPTLPAGTSRADLKPVRVRFTIAASGSCVYEIVTGSGDLNVDALILQACATFRWQPAVKNGQATDSKLIYVFDLKE